MCSGVLDLGRQAVVDLNRRDAALGEELAVVGRLVAGDHEEAVLGAHRPTATVDEDDGRELLDALREEQVHPVPGWIAIRAVVIGDVGLNRDRPGECR